MLTGAGPKPKPIGSKKKDSGDSDSEWEEGCEDVSGKCAAVTVPTRIYNLVCAMGRGGAVQWQAGPW